VTARVGAGVALALAGVLIAATAGPGQGRTLTLRIASVAERAVAPYRVPAGAAGRPASGPSSGRPSTATLSTGRCS
jgi:hypothetical protein